MFCLPLQIDEREYALYVFLEEENLDRMKEYDPAEVNTARLGEAFLRLRLREVIIGYATAADLKTVIELCHVGKPRKALRYMTRGFRYRPDQGDHDGPYLSAKASRKKPS